MFLLKNVLLCTVFYFQLLFINIFLYDVPLQQSFSTCGPVTYRTLIMRALVRSADSQVSIQKLWEWDSEIQVLILMFLKSLRIMALWTGQVLQK